MAKKITICDDEVDIVEMFTLILEDTGAIISTETNSAKLYDELKLDKPDLLILDISMPGLSGDEILQFIRRDDYLHDLPVFMVSGEIDGASRAGAAGATMFFEKPFDIGQFVHEVNKQLS